MKRSNGAKDRRSLIKNGQKSSKKTKGKPLPCRLLPVAFNAKAEIDKYVCSVFNVWASF